MTPEERAELVRRYGYREPIGTSDWHFLWGLLALTVTLPLMGGHAVVFGADAGERVRGGVGFLVGCVLCFWAYQHFKRPLAPEDDADFEREIRYREDSARGDG